MEKRYRAAITAMRSDYSFQRELKLLEKNGFDADVVPLDATRDEERIISSMQEYEYILAGPELWSRRVIEALPKLRMIARLGTGTDAVDLDAAAERGVTVVNTPGANAGAVAQHTVALMLTLSSGICAGDRRVRRGEPGKSVGRELSGATVGLVGFGDIAQRVAEMLTGFHAKVVASYRVTKDEAAAQRLGVELVSREKLLACADYVSLHIPLTEETDKLAGREFFNAMKQDAFFINTARAGIVDEAALHRALAEKKLAGAGLDVYENASLFLDFDNVILTPYMAFSTREGMWAMTSRAIQSVTEHMEGKKISGSVCGQKNKKGELQ